MIVTRTVDETRAALAGLPRPLGFAPTMGALHDGHLSLVAAARSGCASVAGSVFVNPTQFGEGEDYDEYPRDEARDLGLFERHGVELVFAPSAGEMYPPGFATSVVVHGALTSTYEGASRPGHLDGMALVVTKLLAIVRPDVLYLGQKDAQQLAVIRRFVRDLDLPVQVAAVPTMREPDGLAMSSRNALLTTEQRAQAPRLYRALLAGRTVADAPGATARDVIAAAAAALAPSDAPPEAPRFDVDYIAVVDADTFLPQPALGPRSLLVAAARLGTTRLIDNVSLTPSAYLAEDATD